MSTLEIVILILGILCFILLLVASVLVVFLLRAQRPYSKVQNLVMLGHTEAHDGRVEEAALLYRDAFHVLCRGALALNVVGKSTAAVAEANRALMAYNSTVPLSVNLAFAFRSQCGGVTEAAQLGMCW